MPSRPCKFTKTEIHRAVKAVRSCGLNVGRVEIGTDGKIVVFTDTTKDSDIKTELTYNGDRNEWDDVLKSPK